MFRFQQMLKSWIWHLYDAFPPYRIVEGSLDTKETGCNEHYLFVRSVKIQVDQETFNMLVLGEHLQVRYTRGYRAINIDRLISGKGPA